MKFLIFSDLHLELLTKKEIDELLGRLGENEVDICLVAGDISPIFYEEYKYFLNWLNNSFKQSFVILGNHEFYHSSIHKGLNKSFLFNNIYPNINILYNQYCHIQYNQLNYYIGGATLWFEDNPENIFKMDLINCFDWISDLPMKVYDENLKSIKFINKFNDLKKADKKILLTHYLPFNQSVSYKFKGHPANNFYVCDLSKYLKELNFDLIVHGHSHDSTEYMIGNTMVICNPYGYEYQNKQFNFNKIIEIPNRTLYD